MISPYSYRLGLEFDDGYVKAVIIRVLRKRHRLVCTAEFELRPDTGASSNHFSRILTQIKSMLPDKCSLVPISLVLPPDYIVESTVSIPVDSEIDRDDWEMWELSKHLTDENEGYIYESVYVGSSANGEFQTRKIRAVKRRLIDSLMKQSISAGFVLDSIWTPQSILHYVFRKYAASKETQITECIYLGGRSAYVVRTTGMQDQELTSARLPAGESTDSFIETLATYLSWSSDTHRNPGSRILLDASTDDRLADAIVKKLGFVRSESRPISRVLRGTVERPERLILPLAALGAI